MDFSQRRPPGLQPPYGGNLATLNLSIDVGSNAALVDITGLLCDLASALEVGHKWGTDLARAAADWDLAEESYRRGPDWLERALNKEDLLPSRRRRHIWAREPWAWPALFNQELTSLRDIRAERLLGRPTTVSSLTYRNPIELILAGSGMLMAGVILTARLIRDWNAQRRTNAAIAREAEAEAEMTEARADLYRWLVAEAKRGESPLPIGDLTQLVTPPEIKALSRLSETPMRLQLPGSADPAERE